MFLYLLFFYSLSYATYQDEPKRSIYIQPSPEAEVLAIDSQFDTVAIATAQHIFIYSQRSAPYLTNGNLIGTIDLKNFVNVKSTFLELKLLSRLQVFFCDSKTCNFCTVSVHNSSCAHLQLTTNSINPRELLSVSVARSPQKIFVRALHNNYASILSFDVQDYGSILAEQQAVDASFISNQTSVLGFSRASHVYFIGSSYQPNEPLINSELGDEQISLVKITRVCSKDRTKTLESRMDLALACNQSGTISRVGASYYDSSTDQLFITAGERNGDQTVCLFDMAAIDKQFENDWETCQQTNIFDGRRDCEEAADIASLKEHCYIFTRKSDTMQTCLKFGLDSNAHYVNCELHRREGSSYRYGWLENYKPFIGKPVARLSSLDLATSLIPDETNRALFLSYPSGSQQTVLRIPKSSSDISTKEYSKILWKSSVRFTTKKNLGLGNDRNSIVIVNNTEVSILSFACSELYKTCESLASGGWDDNLSCVWCADENRNHVVNYYDKFACSQPLRKVCPPTIDHANRDENILEWQVFGKHLSRLENSIVHVCNEPCVVNRTLSSNDKLYCILKRPQDANCVDVTVAGKLGEYHSFSMKVPKVTNSVGVETEQSSQQKKSSTKVWKAIVAVVVVTIILLLLAVLVWLARKRTLKSASKRSDDNDSRAGFNIVAPIQQLADGNEYQEELRLEPVNRNYERLFEDIDDRLKIEVSALRFEIQIGKGHFGVVNRATYICPDGTQRKVACKMIKEGVSGVREFISEGKIMDRFNHPRVMQLVGISFTDNMFPIIITDYMPMGDLVSYLRDKQNSPTLRNLLQFAAQIAEGMEYLHSCNFIHRDLAARNCMLDSSLDIKIADFGLCRECNENEEYEPSIKNRDLPLRWMSVEAMQDEKFTFQGDVWAYGIVLWELTTRGMIPYGNMKGYALIEFLRSGQRLAVPPYCPMPLYHQIMLPCWSADPAMRPTFTKLVDDVNALVRSMETTHNTQLYSHYEKVSSLNSATQDSSGSRRHGSSVCSEQL